MLKSKLLLLFLVILIGQLVSDDFIFASTSTGTIDPTYRYAWGENIGWIDFACSNCGITVTDSGLSGYALNENVGWIYLNDVDNDSEGNLSGYAWSENTGWINFNPANGGVIINSSGEFTGSALSENAGWIIFSGDYAVKTDWRPYSARSGGGGGGMSPSAYNPPAPPVSSPTNPKGEFKVLINDNAEFTKEKEVVLKFVAGEDTEKMAISSSPDFSGPESGQISYQSFYNWDLCYQERECSDGIHTVYVKFYTQYGQASEIVFDDIILDATAPKIENINIKDFYYSNENIILSGSTEPGAEIFLFYNQKYGSVFADGSGYWKANLAVLPLGRYVLEITSKDKIGNTSEPLKFDLTIIELSIGPVPSAPEEIIPEPEPEPKEIITVSESVPLVMKGEWRLLPSKSINLFVLAPLPDKIKILAEKFPELEKTFEEVGIVKVTDVEKLKTAELTLPNLTEILELPAPEIGLGKFTLPKGIPIAELPIEIKQKMPSEIIFAQAGGRLIDFNVSLSVTEKGEPEQKIATISGKPLQLTVRPENPVETVKGYVIFKGKLVQSEPSKKTLGSLVSSLLFASPIFTYFQKKPVEVEEKLLLFEFEYKDEDKDGIYTAEIQAPIVEGEYEIITVMDYQDPELANKEIRLIAVIDPEGYVYEKIKDKEARVSGAIVSLYRLNPETKQYELWPAKDYQQENPQITNNTGKYSFLVPEGSYYLIVEAPSYLIYEGKSFQVKEGSGVHLNIELKTKYWWLKYLDWKTGLLILVIILLLYNFYRDKIREKLLKYQK